ncbi:uncharacterized protein BP01DRAFT_37909 [Aspergillus saccharolyticus JOP 1030-1]|uniref:Uncharacterized protein n=1 Tax=Aspergillus saccharolyticus JOP 1030-1 TaxID=1450539 RepID=A0A318ZHB1_9EURO|nr:hypothetical protein BP01DRAFT_37909 [Aspergillus saccharolyticus JOP 1030-1]PYH45734.1 hypothetical protein BP01DRAFT_37909 [Aspergillus saccharolyticus JOP 1030-1]
MTDQLFDLSEPMQKMIEHEYGRLRPESQYIANGSTAAAASTRPHSICSTILLLLPEELRPGLPGGGVQIGYVKDGKSRSDIQCSLTSARIVVGTVQIQSNCSWSRNASSTGKMESFAPRCLFIFHGGRLRDLVHGGTVHCYYRLYQSHAARKTEKRERERERMTRHTRWPSGLGPA